MTSDCIDADFWCSEANTLMRRNFEGIRKESANLIQRPIKSDTCTILLTSLNPTHFVHYCVVTAYSWILKATVSDLWDGEAVSFLGGGCSENFCTEMISTPCDFWSFSDISCMMIFMRMYSRLCRICTCRAIETGRVWTTAFLNYMWFAKPHTVE